MDFVIIGLSGKSHSGKSTSRDFIKEFTPKYDYEFIHHSFAAKLKDIAYQVFGWDGDKTFYPQEDKGRKLLINIGTYMRQIRATVWADYVIDLIKNDIVLEKAHKRIYVIDDVRFQNEVELLRSVFGNKFLWININRPGTEEIDSDSERGLDSCADYDGQIINTNIEDLKVSISHLVLNAITKSKERVHA